MALRDVLTTAVQTAFSAIDDIPVNGEFIQVSSVHDPDTATTQKQEIAHAVQIVVTKYTRQEIAAAPQGDIRATDFKAILRQAELPVQPTTNDVVEWKEPTKAIETRFKIVNFNKDPADVIWVLQLRAN